MSHRDVIEARNVMYILLIWSWELIAVFYKQILEIWVSLKFQLKKKQLDPVRRLQC